MVEKSTSCTNKKSIIINEGEGGTIYLNYTPYTLEKETKRRGLSIFNRLAPSPQVDMKFWSINKIQ